MLSSELHFRAVLYEPVDVTNDMEELDAEMQPCEKFYCSLVPANGRIDTSLPGEVLVEDVTHKITLRMHASRRLRKPGGRQHTRLLIDGVWYDVLYVLPHYQQRDRMIVYAKIRAD